MKISVSLALDGGAQSTRKSVLFFFDSLNEFIQTKDYGNSVMEWLIILQIVNPPKGYEHLHKHFKPKFITSKSMTNRLTGELLIIEKQFSYSIEMTGTVFDELVQAGEERTMQLLATATINSLSNFDTLAKTKDFDKERFKDDVLLFFTSKGWYMP